MLINITWAVAKCQAHNLIFLIWWMIHQGASERGSERGRGTESDRRERERLGGWDKWPLWYFQINRNPRYLYARSFQGVSENTVLKTWARALEHGYKAVKAQPCLFLQRMLTPGAFLYSQIAVLNYRCRGNGCYSWGELTGEKRQRKLEYPADCKHLSSCRLLTPLRLQQGMELTLIPAAMGPGKATDHNNLGTTRGLA